MAQQNINFGTFPDDPAADSIRTSFQKVQQNFTDLYSGAVVTGVSKINAGDGVTINRTTGNVVVSSKIASLAFESPPDTLLYGTNGISTDETVVVYNSGSNTQTTNPIKITLSPNLKLANVTVSGTTNIGPVTNLKVTGGSPGYVLHKSIQPGAAAGDLEWRPVSQTIPLVSPVSPAPNQLFYLTGSNGLDPSNLVICNHTATINGKPTAIRIFMIPESGTVAATGFDSISDKTQKTDIRPIQDALEKINTLSGVTFKYIHSDAPSAGLIAQEVQAVLPQATTQGHDDILRLNYNGVVGLLVEAVKTLTTEVTYLKQQISTISK